MSRILALQKAYRDKLGEADAIRNPYANTTDPMPDDEAARFDRCMEDADRLFADLEREEKAAKAARTLSEPAADSPALPVTGKAVAVTDETKGLQLRAMGEFFKFGLAEGDFKGLNTQLKTLQADLDVSGGYLTAPQVFVEQLLANVKDIAFIRQFATTFTLRTAESLGVPTLDTDLNDADWTTELATGSQDDANAFGKRELRPHPFAKRVKISNRLLRQALIDPEALVRDRIAYKFGITEEKAFMTGSGAGQPLGLFTASALGIDTSRDVSTGMTTTAITADGLINVKGTLKPQYLPKARWIFHRDAITMIRKLKDGNGQYLWGSGLGGGGVQTICDLPFIQSEYAPNTFTTGLYAGILGDLSFYWIADALSLSVQRVVELYAESDVTGFIARAEADGMPVLAEPFVRVKLA